MNTKRDLDSPEAISDFVESFYNQLLADAELGPIFVDTAQIELEHHLPKIKAFWRKLLLGEIGYNNHMMNIHLTYPCLLHTKYSFLDNLLDIDLILIIDQCAHANR